MRLCNTSMVVVHEKTIIIFPVLGRTGVDLLQRFQGRFNIMMVMLHRPSPQISEPSIASAQTCFDAASFNIGMHRQQIATKSIDLTWIFTQSLFMALNTILWSVSYAEVREDHSRKETEKLLGTAQEGIRLAAERWPGVESALALYDRLCAACLKVYECENVTFRLAGSSSSRPWPGNTKATPRHHQTLRTSATLGFTSFTHNDCYGDGLSPMGYLLQFDHRAQPQSYSSPARSEDTFTDSDKSDISRSDKSRLPTFTTPFDQTLAYNAFSTAVPDLRPWTLPAQQVPDQFLGFIGDQYLQYFHAPYVHCQSICQLNQEEQMELMHNLETNGLNDGT